VNPDRPTLAEAVVVFAMILLIIAILSLVEVR
jgi:hypothetical protein